MIASETEYGDLDLRIAGSLFDLVAKHLGSANPGRVCHFLERLPLRTVVCLERLAVDNSDLARDYLRRIIGQQARPRLRLVGQGAPHG